MTVTHTDTCTRRCRNKMDYDDGIPDFLRRAPRTTKQRASDKKFGEMTRTPVQNNTHGYENRPACLLCLGDGVDDDGHVCGGCEGTGFTEHE